MMYRILLFFCLIALGMITTSCKRDKLLEKSAPERPVWVHGIERGFIIVEGQGKNHDEAKKEAFINLRESIVNSVAVNVSSTVQMDVTENVIDNLRQFKEDTKINTTITSDFLYALRGVQLNKATDWYWESRRTAEKIPYVVYHVKYPFTEKELDNYIREWEAMDAELGAALNSLAERAAKASSVTELVAMRDEGVRLSQIFKEPRKTLAINTSNRIDQKLKDARIEVSDHDRGQITMAIRSNGQRLRAESMPYFKSGCAVLDDMRFSETEGLYVIHYDPSFCTGMQDEFITLETTIDGRNLSEKIVIPSDSNLVRIGINGPLVLHRVEQGDLHTWRLPVRLFNEADVELMDIEIVVERVSQRFFAALSKKGRAGLNTYINQPLGQKLPGKGDHTITFEAVKYTSSIDDMVNSMFDQTADYQASGKIMYKRNDAEETRTYRFEGVQVVLK